MPADPCPRWLVPEVGPALVRQRADDGAIAMVRTPLLAHERDARKRLLADLEAVQTFIAAIDTIHAQGDSDVR